MARIEKLTLSEQLDDATRSVAGQDEVEFLEAKRTKFVIRRIVDALNEIEEINYTNQRKLWEVEKKINQILEQLNVVEETQ